MKTLKARLSLDTLLTRFIGVILYCNFLETAVFQELACVLQKESGWFMLEV